MSLQYEPASESRASWLSNSCLYRPRGQVGNSWLVPLQGIRSVQFSIEEQLLRKIVKRLLGGLVFKAHRLLCHSILGSRVIKKKKIDAAGGGGKLVKTGLVREMLFFDTIRFTSSPHFSSSLGTLRGGGGKFFNIGPGNAAGFRVRGRLACT